MTLLPPAAGACADCLAGSCGFVLVDFPAASDAEVIARPERKSLRFMSPSLSHFRNAEGYHEGGSCFWLLAPGPWLSAFGFVKEGGWKTANSHRYLLRCVLVCTEAQQRGHAACLFQIRIAVDEFDFGAIAQCQINQGIGDISDFARFMATNCAAPHHARIQMTAVDALHRFGLKIATHHQRLHFLTFQRGKHMAQPQSAARIALCFSHYFAQQRLLLSACEFGQYPISVRAHLLC